MAYLRAVLLTSGPVSPASTRVLIATGAVENSFSMGEAKPSAHAGWRESLHPVAIRVGPTPRGQDLGRSPHPRMNAPQVAPAMYVASGAVLNS